jgi:adenylate cyclase class 2
VKFNDPDLQHDCIYTEGNWEFVKFQNDRNILRIRQQTGRNLLTLKRPGINDLHNTEHETAIADVGEMNAILELMGYKLMVEVRKKRRKANAFGLDFCLDEVEGLGWYVEVEKLTEDSSDVELVQEELFSFLETVGITREDRETRGYDVLVFQKQTAA